VHLAHWLASDQVIAVEDAGWFFRHGNIEVGNERFDRALSYYLRVIEVATFQWWGWNSKDVARSLVNLVHHVIEYYTRLMGDKAQNLRAVADDEGMTVGELREAIDIWKSAKGELTAVIEDSPLARLRLRFAKRLREIELPPEGFTTKAQAQAVQRLSGTFYQLQAMETGLGLPVTPKPERMREAERVRASYLRSHNQAGDPVPVRRRGRPRRDALREQAEAFSP
jgi:hypothetical protein